MGHNQGDFFMTSYDKFEQHIAQVNDLCCVLNLLNWDARTQMPAGGNKTRGNQMGTVARLAQELFVGEKTARLLDDVEAEIADESPDSCRVRAVSQARKAFELSRRVPVELVAELHMLKGVAQQYWEEAKNSNNFAIFQPYLERMLSLCRRLSDYIGYEEHPYDALVMRYEPGLTAARLNTLFAELKETILPILKRAVTQGEPRLDFLLEQDYPEQGQRDFAIETARAFGYDFNRGRLDLSAHPFEISFTRNDVRITTRYNRRFLPQSLFGTLHETGHALYEQNVDAALTRTALATDLLDLYAVGGVSYGTHESQSRLWENLVGRSRVFWNVHYDRLKRTFPTQLAHVSLEEFYRAINRVHPSPIRTEADEVTYNLHIMLRVEIEMALVEGSLAVKDLPRIWNEKIQEYLGITPLDDTQGVLQDVHWSAGLVGSFPTYTIGNIMSAQWFEAARSDTPEIDEALAEGNYVPLFDWLRENLWRHGRAFSARELLQRATGSDLNTTAYRSYLTRKYGELFPQ
jgi:carboxypeptidase Taq